MAVCGLYYFPYIKEARKAAKLYNKNLETKIFILQLTFHPWLALTGFLTVILQQVYLT